MAYRDLKRFPLQLWVLFAATLVNRMGTMVLPFLAIYLTHQRGFSIDKAGMVLAIYGAGTLISGVGSGWLCERLGAARAMVWCLVIAAAIMFLFPFAESLTTIVIFTVLLSIFNEMARPMGMTLTSEFSPSELRKSAFAIDRLAINLGMSIGPIIGGILAQRSFLWIFVIDGATTLLAAIVVTISFVRLGCFKKKGPSSPDTTSDRSAFASFKAALRDPTLRYFLIPAVLLSMVFFQHESTLPIYLVNELMLSPVTYGLMFTVNTVMIIFLELPLNIATSHWSLRKTLFIGSLFNALGFGSIAFVRSVWGLFALVAVWTFGEMMTFPAASAYVSEISPPHRRATYMGLFTASFGLSFILGPMGGAFLMQHFGSTTLWLASLSCGLVSTLLFLKVKDIKASAT